MKKCYLLLLICASTRCVYLERVIDYVWQSLVLALTHFISQRGTSKLFISDNFSTFKSREVQEVTDFLRHFDISWEFILQELPWCWGFNEKLIGITKMSLKKVVGKARLSYDELVTVKCEIENSINSSPFTYLKEENHQTPLLPFRLLYGWNIKPLDHIKTNQTSAIIRVKHLQTVLEHFKRDFMLNMYLVYVKNILMLKIKHRASVIWRKGMLLL